VELVAEFSVELETGSELPPEPPHPANKTELIKKTTSKTRNFFMHFPFYVCFVIENKASPVI
jgi:hypothetical protein